MKRFLTILVVGVVALGGLLVFNASRLPAPPAPVGAVEPIPLDAEQAADRLARSVRLATVSYASGAPIDTAAFRAFHALVATEFPRLHATLQREVIGGLSLLYTWRGGDSTKAPVVLMGHMDVVPVPAANLAEWTHPPFGGVIADGYVWGRGTLDDKTTVLATLEAVERSLEAGFVPARTVYLMFGHDEENGGRFGARTIVDTLVARGVKPALVVDEGGFLASGVIPGVQGRAAIVGIAEKGYVSFRLTAAANGGHSSMPPSRTAVGALSRAVMALEANPFPSSIEGPTRGMLEAMAPYASFGQKVALANLWLTAPLVERAMRGSPLGAALLRTTTAPTMLEAGVKDNVLPPVAEAIVNFRIRPGETHETVLARVREIVNDTLVAIDYMDSVRVNPSPVSSVSSPAYALVASTIRSLAPAERLPVLPYLVMGGTDAKYWGAHTDNAFRFLPVPLGDGDQARIHGVNERIRVEDYGVAVTFFTRLLRGIDTLPE